MKIQHMFIKEQKFFSYLLVIKIEWMELKKYEIFYEKE